MMWVLPGYLLHSAIFQSLSRDGHVDRLSLMFAIMLVYFERWEVALLERGKRGQVYQNAAFSREQTAKYLIVPLKLIEGIVSHPRDAVYLGAFGSHLDEHFFALMRRTSGGKCSADATMTQARKSVLVKMLMNLLGIELHVPKVMSDSGVTIPAGEEYILKPFGYYLDLAEQIFQLVAPVAGQERDCSGVLDYVKRMLVDDKPKARVSMTSSQFSYLSTGCSGQRQSLAAQRMWTDGGG
jgi:hypothetical protein